MVFQDSKVDNFADFLFFFFFLLIIIRSGLRAEIRWSVCILKSHWSLCMSVIFKGRCWVVHIPFVGMVKFKCPAHFSVDHIAHTVEPSLVLLLCQFAAFIYYVIDHFISVTIESTFAIFLRLIYPRFDMIGSYGAVLCCHYERFCFSLKVSLS